MLSSIIRSIIFMFLNCNTSANVSNFPWKLWSLYFLSAFKLSTIPSLILSYLNLIANQLYIPGAKFKTGQKMTLVQTKSLLRWVNTFKRFDFCDFLNYDYLTKNKKSWYWLSHGLRGIIDLFRKKTHTRTKLEWKYSVSLP